MCTDWAFESCNSCSIFHLKKPKLITPQWIFIMHIKFAHTSSTHYNVAGDENRLWKWNSPYLKYFSKLLNSKHNFYLEHPVHISNKFSSHDFSMTWWKSKSLFNCQSADCYHFLSSYLDWQDFWKISRASLLQNTPPWPTFLKERKLLRHTEYESTHRDQISFCTKE